jgi:hypothetical protein
MQSVRVQLLEGSVPKYVGVVGVLVVPVSVVSVGSVEVDVKHSSGLFGDSDQHGGVLVAIPAPTSPAAKAATTSATLRAVTQAAAELAERLDMEVKKRGKLANPFRPVKRERETLPRASKYLLNPPATRPGTCLKLRKRPHIAGLFATTKKPHFAAPFALRGRPSCVGPEEPRAAGPWRQRAAA